MNNIVALRSGALGDCIVSYPALRLLRRRFPEASITVIGDPYGGPILAASGFVDRVLYLSHRGRKGKYVKELKELRREGFDLLVDFQVSGHSRIQAGLIRADRSIALDKGHWMANFVYTDIVEFDYSVHAAQRIANTLKPLGLEASDSDMRAEILLEERHRTEARRLLKDRGIYRPYVILQATTGQRPEYRHWPAERFAAVADHLSRLGFAVVLTSAAMSDALREVIDCAAEPIYNLTGATDPLVLAALLEGAHLYVGYNTGPMHLAAAVATPIVALFDVPSDELQWSPLASAPCRIVKAKPVPQPPGWRMDTVDADEVIEAVDHVLSEVEEDAGVVERVGERELSRVQGRPVMSGLG